MTFRWGASARVTAGVVAAIFAPSPAPAQEVELRGPLASPMTHEQCVLLAKTLEEREACPPPEKPVEVNVRAKPPPRSASDWEVDSDIVRAAPHQSGADVLGIAPGVFVSDRGLPGRAPHLSLRGFDGTSGQDVEIFAGMIPMNQVSHLRAPGYADMRLVMPEIVKSVQIASGPYDPRQGDFAIAGSLRMNLGLAQPGFWAKGGVGSFGARRVFLAFAPKDHDLNETFAAFAADSTDGPGGARGGERSSFVGQLGGGDSEVEWRVVVAIGSARFDFPGFVDRQAVERGGDPYAVHAVGRDQTSQTLIGGDVLWSVGDGTLGIASFGGKTKTTFHQNLTGFTSDVAAGGAPVNPDDAEQVNDASTFGLNVLYRHGVAVTSPRDALEIGIQSRVDVIDQTETRLFSDGTANGRPVDATIDATGVGAYADVALYPVRRLVIRGGPRLDSISYDIEDRASGSGLDRTAQGFHLGNKITSDLAVGGGVHLVASYGDGFRTPLARELDEGERVPFTTSRSVEAGARFRSLESLPGLRSNRLEMQASLVGFGSWLGHDRVFDATSRQNLEAPPSVRAGAAATFSTRVGPFGSTASATLTHAAFTGSNGTFATGERVPYAPAFVLRDDAFVAGKLVRIAGRSVTGRVGAGVESAVGRALPGGGQGSDVLSIDGLAAIGWRGVELGVDATNLLGRQNYESQYVYVSNFERSATLPPPTSHVLVAAPTAIFVTLTLHVRGSKSEDGQREEKECLRKAPTEDDAEDCYE